MKEGRIRSALNTALYWTFHLLEDPDEFEGLSEGDFRDFRAGHSQDDFSAMVEALAWAKAHPEVSFSTMLPGLLYSDEQIYRYLTILHRQFSQAGKDQP